MKLGSRIAAWRHARGMTQLDLADAVGVTRYAVYLWEHDKSGISTGTLSRLVGALDLTMVKFYGRVPPPKAKAS